jgi:bicarbonate transport system ATP-binding protein
LDIWSGHPGKVLGVREDWALSYPNTHIALTKALLEACRYCADHAHWSELSELLSDRRYLGMKQELIRFGNAGGDKGQDSSPHSLFFGPAVNRPSRSEHLWILTQLARWSEIPFPRNYVEILERICAVSVYSTAARELGLDDVSYQRGASNCLTAWPSTQTTRSPISTNFLFIRIFAWPKSHLNQQG